MEVKTYSYRYAKEILEHNNYKHVYQEIIEICKNCPLPVYKNKSSKQKKLDIVQQIMNTYFRLEFIRRGWEIEPAVTPSNNTDELRSDFRKTFKSNGGDSDLTVQIEVEFGNVASSYRNYFKFQLSYSYDMADICILIVPSSELSRRIDSGVSNFEKVVREIPSSKLSLTVPTLVIGLFDRDDSGEKLKEWDVRKLSNDLKIIKGSNAKTIEEHSKLVNKYIEINKWKDIEEGYFDY